MIRRANYDVVIQSICESYGVEPSAIKARLQIKGICEPRHLAMYALRAATKASLPEIGRALGKHHTSVLHGIERAQQIMAADGYARSAVEKAIAKVTGERVYYEVA